MRTLNDKEVSAVSGGLVMTWGGDPWTGSTDYFGGGGGGEDRTFANLTAIEILRVITFIAQDPVAAYRWYTSPSYDANRAVATIGLRG